MDDPAERVLIAEGATAELFAFGPGRVLKRYRSGFSQGIAEWEAEQARKAARCLAGSALRTPAVYTSGVFDERPGVIFERVDGDTLLTRLFALPERSAEEGKAFARLHLDLHHYSGDGMPAQKARLRERCEDSGLDPETIRRGVALLASLLEGDRLCHGDFHPMNIVLSSGEPVIIDWVDAVQGNPLADVARTVLLMLTASVPPVPGFTDHGLWRLRKEFVAGYWNEYRHLMEMDFDEAQFLQWLYVIAVARCAESGRDAKERRRLTRLLRTLSALETEN